MSPNISQANQIERTVVQFEQARPMSDYGGLLDGESCRDVNLTYFSKRCRTREAIVHITQSN